MSKNYCKVDHKWCKFCKKTDTGFCCTFNNELFKSLKNIRKCPKREARETISLRSLLKQVNLYDVITAMLKSHPNEKKNVIGYFEVYTHLLDMKGVKTNAMLRCRKTVWDNDLSSTGEKHSCIDIYGVYENNKEYAIEFVPWAEWLTMNIEEETLQCFTKEEIVAAALWEMTYNGYTEERVNEHRQALINSFKEIEND